MHTIGTLPSCNHSHPHNNMFNSAFIYDPTRPQPKVNTCAPNVGAVELVAISSNIQDISNVIREMRGASNYSVTSNSAVQKSTLHSNQNVEEATWHVPIHVFYVW